MNFKSFLDLNKLLEAYDYHAEDDADDSDKWLAKWTYEGLDKWPSRDTLDELLEKYPYEGGTLYRGLNFRDKEQFDTFMEETEGGNVLHTGSVTSWTANEGTTYPFAITRPTYFLNRELMQAESQKQKNRDFMIGHAGLVLETHVGVGHGIDVQKSEYGKESEVILAPGTYKITIRKEYIPFVRSITPDNFKEKFMALTTIHSSHDEYQSKIFEHIMFHYKDFDDEMKHHLFVLITQNIKKIRYGVDVEMHSSYWDNGEDKEWPRIEVYWNVPPSFFIYYSMLLPEDQAQIDGQLDEVIYDLEEEFEVKTKDIDFTRKFELDINNSVALAVRMEHLADKLTFMHQMRKAVGKRYNHLNSYDMVKKINSIKDPRAQQDAIKQLAKDIEQALNQGHF